MYYHCQLTDKEIKTQGVEVTCPDLKSGKAGTAEITAPDDYSVGLWSLTAWIWVRVSPFRGEGNGTRLQYSCLENPVGGGAW